jgi:ABC-type phosphate/phosphonate transport system substrate-binding protein
MSPWKVALPMYAITAPLRDANRRFLEHFVADLKRLGWPEPVQIVDADFAHIDDHWLDPHLLLSQTCGYPLMTRLHGKVSLLALPCYRAEGFSDGQYRSRLIVAQHSPFATLADLRGAVAAINGTDSHSGMNALRHTLAPFNDSGTFLREVRVSGSHVNSIEYVRNGRADIAAIDPVTWAHLLDEEPQRLAEIRTLGWTAPAPGLPLIGSHALSTEQTALIRAALATSLQNAPQLARTLRFERFADIDWLAYQRILEMQAASV